MKKVLLLLMIVTALFACQSGGETAERVKVDVSEAIELGGLPQWITAKGNSSDNPLLLVIHGGPAMPAAPIMLENNTNLFDHFILVNWDQRGAGKSYSPELINRETLTKELLLSDTIELVKYLKKRFNKEKIYLAGHSWGSFIGLKTVAAYPEHFYAYIGISQIVNPTEGELISYNYALERAKDEGNEEAIKALTELGPPVDGEYTKENGIYIQRNWLYKMGGIEHSPYVATNWEEFIKNTTYYTEEEKANYLPAIYRSMELLWDATAGLSFAEQVKEVEVPIFFIAGRYDYLTPGILPEEYCKELKAPHAETIWFEESGHSPHYEEPEQFLKVLKEQILPKSYK